MSDPFLQYTHCRLCPRNCGIDRRVTAGFCGETDVIRIAWSGLHFGEEPPLSAAEGSGTVFFNGCNLGCLFCQNHQISRPHSSGTVYTPEETADLFLCLQKAGAENINLVTGTPHLPGISEALKQARKNGLIIPVIWNSSGYETKETIEILNDLIDIYLPDLKTLSTDTASCYLKAPDYPETATAAIEAMCRAKPPVTVPFYNERLGLTHQLMKQGVIIRHLALPGETADSLRITDFYENRYRPLGALFSLITDYIPSKELPQPLNRTLSAEEESILLDKFFQKNWEDCYFQETEEEDQDWKPDFCQRDPFPSGFCRTVK